NGLNAAILCISILKYKMSQILKFLSRRTKLHISESFLHIIIASITDLFVYMCRATTKDKQRFETVLNLFGTVNVDESKWINRDRGAEFILIKTEAGPYWKRLLKEDTKYH